MRSGSVEQQAGATRGGVGRAYIAGVVLALAMGAFTAWGQPAGRARAVLGVAGMQALPGVAIAMAPITASAPAGAWRALLFDRAFSVLWLLAAACFRAAARGAAVSG